MTERKMNVYEFARTTYDPVLTEKLDKIVDKCGLALELTPPHYEYLDAIASGSISKIKEAKLKDAAYNTHQLNHKNKIATQPVRVSTEEMRQASITRDFLDEQESAEFEFNAFSYFRSGPYILAYQQPRERAWYKAQALSLDEASGISIDALEKVNRMYAEAYEVNQAYDVVKTNGANIETPKQNRPPEGSRLRGDNFGGLGTFRIPLLKTHSRTYDIQGGSAVRWSHEQTSYVPFAPQHQERALDAITKAVIKGMDRSDDRLRADSVKKAKEVLGRAGVKIPKPMA